MTLLGLLWFIIVGTLAGLLAKFIYPRHKKMRWVDTMLLGIAGSVVGGWIGGLLHLSNGSPGGIFTATIGALLLLYGYDRFKNRG